MSTRKALLLAALLLVAGATPAIAHVQVSPAAAAKGATAATFTFVVPNEESPAKTTSIEIVFPQGVSFSRIAPLPKPGWTVTPSESSVTWSGGSIAGEEQEAFSLTLGPLPNADALVFKAIQTYDSGNVVRWIGSPSSDNPAPVVTLTGNPVPVATTTPRLSPTPSVVERNVEDENDPNVLPIVLGALVLVGVGVGIAIGARRRSGDATDLR